MTVLFDRPFFTTYGQFYLVLGDSYDITENTCAGQHNGLLRSAWPTLLHVIVGLHTGDVNLRIELLDRAPEEDTTWEELVEAPFTVPPDTTVTLEPCIGNDSFGLDIPAGDYRVRYGAVGFGLTDRSGRDAPGFDPGRERYVLQFWKAPRAPDAILRSTNPHAGYWHDVAQGR